MFSKIYAATPQQLGTIGGPGLGPFANITSGVEGLNGIAKLVSSVIGVMTIAAGIWFLFNFVIGGIEWVGSGGDKHNLEQARQRITNAFIGLIIVVAGWTILALAGKFIGIDILLVDPVTIIKQLSP